MEQRLRTPIYVSAVDRVAGKKVLDLGSADGFYTKYALDKGATVKAVDISQSMLDILTKRINNPVNNPALSTENIDISIPMPILESDSFDYVILSLVLHFIQYWETLLAELYRVMKPGGRLIASTHHPFVMYEIHKPDTYFDFKLVERTWGEEQRRPVKVHYYIRPLKDILKPIIQSKFKIISIDEPLPEENVKQSYPELYHRFKQEPAFLFLILER